MPELVVTPLLRGEERRWFAVVPAKSDPPPRITEEATFQPGSRLVAESGGVPVGRITSILVEGHEAIVLHPVVATGADLGDVGAALVDAAIAHARSLRIAHVEMLFRESIPRRDEILALAPRWGFELKRTKELFFAKAESVRWDVARADRRLTFRAADGPADPALVATYARVLEGSWESDLDAARELGSFVVRCGADGCLHPEDWEIALLDGRPAGVVIPAFCDGTRREGTNLHVGLVPEARGRGWGATLHLRGLATIRRRGAEVFYGSCDTRNAAMRRVFERVGYARETTQYLLALRGDASRSASADVLT